MLDDWQLRLPTLNDAYACRELIGIRAMALNDTGNPKNRDPADIVLTALAFVIMVSFFGTIWWYVI